MLRQGCLTRALTQGRHCSGRDSRGPSLEGLQRRVTALRIDDLRQVCRVIDDTGADPVELRDRAILALHHLGVSGSAIARLEWSDIRLTQAQALVRVPSLSGAAGPRVLRVRANRERPRSCPLAALTAWADFARGQSGEAVGPVFWLFDARVPMCSPMSPHAVNRLWKHRLSCLGDGTVPATHEQAMALLGDRHPVDLRDKAMLTLGFAGAMRRGEVTGLRWSDLRLRDGGLSVSASPK